MSSGMAASAWASAIIHFLLLCGIMMIVPEGTCDGALD
jgi:hypothetical protein